MAQLTDVTGISETRAENLRDEGYSTVDDVATADPLQLEEVHGVGAATAEDLVEAAQEVITQEHTSEEEGDDGEEEGREDVDLEDIEQINEEPPEGYDEPEEVEDEEDEEPEETVDSGPDRFTVEIEVANDEQYDYFMKALVDMRLERSNNNQDSENAVVRALNAMRPLGGEGSFEVEVNARELNRIHSAVQQAETRHQQNRQSDAFEQMRDIKRRVDEIRSEYIF